MSQPSVPAEATAYTCHACDRSFPTLAALRVHAVLDERRPLTPAEQAGSTQLSLFLQPLRKPTDTPPLP